MVSGFDILCESSFGAEMCIDDTSRSNESKCNDRLAQVRKQICLVCNLNKIVIITPIMRNMCRIGITLHDTKG